jgi:hypothetical protein
MIFLTFFYYFLPNKMGVLNETRCKNKVNEDIDKIFRMNFILQ